MGGVNQSCLTILAFLDILFLTLSINIMCCRIAMKSRSVLKSCAYLVLYYRYVEIKAVLWLFLLITIYTFRPCMFILKSMIRKLLGDQIEHWSYESIIDLFV